ncbi:NBR1-Ig-like domain-containing protein [Pelolinea submarina]|uniref:Ig-like domain-containing protein n=1 Tax=Pelolinea submarina TaxID=913107 RepID=A0A3E0AI90_9CHLR|nr:NBR1-Ig-like domain-containing protein [Pelolinea submarina]REG11368.1 Ig-like domain-containing protein [Pelolinea submarina]
MKKYSGLLTILAVLLVSSACYFPTVMTEDEAVATEVQKVLEDIQDETATANAAATYTPYPTYTPAPTYTPQATAWVNPYYNPYYNQYIPSDSGGRYIRSCNNAEFIGENFYDYAIFNNGTVFTKTWVLRNTGVCTWTTDYKLVFKYGNSMSSDISSNLPYDVPPGGIVELSVDMKAPAADGTYKGYWTIQSDVGEQFFDFWVAIKVR